MLSPVWPLTLIHRPNIPGSYAILFFRASDFTSITSHIHNWVLFLLWLHLFILSGVISLLFSSSISGTYQPGEFIFQCPIFLPFHTVHAVLKARMLKWLAIPFSSGPCFVRSLHHGHECGETDSWRAQTKPCAQQDPETAQKLSQNCVWVSPEEVWVSSGLPQGLWVQQTWVWHKLSRRRSPLTPPQSRQNLHRTGETDPWRAQMKPCVHQGPGERSSDPTGEWPRLALSVQESPVEAWVGSGLVQARGHWVRQCMHGTFEGSEVAQSCATVCYPMDCITYQATLSMEFSRQEDWSGLPCPSPGDLPDLGDQTQVSCIAGRCFTFCTTKETQGNPLSSLPPP